MLGLACCICGEVTRKLAMLHAGNGFTHRLALSKRPDHRLVTTGIYAVFRHPGYTGLFHLCWSQHLTFVSDEMDEFRLVFVEHRHPGHSL